MKEPPNSSTSKLVNQPYSATTHSDNKIQNPFCKPAESQASNFKAHKYLDARTVKSRSVFFICILVLSICSVTPILALNNGATQTKTKVDFKFGLLELIFHTESRKLEEPIN